MSATARISGILAGLLLLAALAALVVAGDPGSAHHAGTTYRAGLIWDTAPEAPATGQVA
ncbi:hypothetical protein [Winogradskya consettensis]|nr:hypothetical protein [Actinoplanes consettensis]